MLVHGASRGVNTLTATFAPLAESAGIPLLIPNFTSPDFTGYQYLAGAAGGLAAADALDSLLYDLGWHKRTIDLAGFSGGGQFAHRYALISSISIRRAVVAAAGWYTMLDPEVTFPFGTGDGPALGGRPVSVDALLALPLRIMVGEQDVRRDAWLRTGSKVDAQGPNRLVRAHRWYEHLVSQAAGRRVPCQASFEMLPATGHTLRQAAANGGYVRRVATFLADV